MGQIFKSWKSLDSLQQIAIAGAVLTAIIGVFGYLLSGGTHYIYVGLVLTTMVALVADRARQYIFENDLRQQFSRVINQAADLRFVGQSPAGIEWIERRCAGAALVRNTVFLRQGNPFYQVDPTLVKRLELTAARVLLEGGEWNDVFVSDQRPVIDAFYNQLNADQRKRYKATEISAEIPLIQITIINFSAGRREVLVGFGFKGATQEDTKVFHSDDKSTVGYFDAYLSQLSSKGADVYNYA